MILAQELPRVVASYNGLLFKGRVPKQIKPVSKLSIEMNPVAARGKRNKC